MSTETTVHKAGWRRLSFRLSLRATIVAVVAIGGLLGWLSYRARVQRTAVAAAERAGAKVIYSFQETGQAQPAWWRPHWLVDAVGVDYLAHVTRIQDDSLAQGSGEAKGLSDADLASVGRLDHLETLTLWGSPGVTDAGLAHLRGLARLKRLEIAAASGVSGAALAHLASLTQLEQLQFITPRIKDADLAHLSGLVHLRYLTLMLDEKSDVTDAGLAFLGNLSELRFLQLDRAREITNAGLTHLGKLTKLEFLSLTNAPVTDLKGLEPLTSLEGLTLMGSRIDDAGFAPVSHFSRLTNLSAGNALTDAGLIHLKGLPSLVSADLRGTKITDAGMATLAECPQLERLHLAFNPITDAGLAKLDKLPRLKLLDLMLTKVTDGGVEAAKTAHPGLQVLGPQMPGSGMSFSVR